MELVDFRKDLIEDIKATASANNEGTVQTFVDTVLKNLEELNVISDYELCFYTGKFGRKNYRIDAYSFDDYDCSMSIFAAEFNGDTTNEIETITRSDATTIFERIQNFISASYESNLKNEIEISIPAYDLVEKLTQLEHSIRKFRLFILTDKQMSEKIGSFEQSSILGKPVEYHLWDINRLFRTLSSTDGHEPIEINFEKIKNGGLPCLEASDAGTNDIRCFLSVIPGNTLADLYDTYGSMLLEGNVRSFLSTKVKVNKNIRKTIIEADGESKRNFFSYNNGISATASSVSIADSPNGKLITAVKNLQIVNGGQTTASLSSARYKDKADLNGIFVQMKLTEIPNPEVAQILIPKISRGSNSQNKVSDADFFSNHEFNIRMEKFSREIYAPATGGQQYETHWFFERARGQYSQEQSKMTKGEKTKFQNQNPPRQKFTKTDFAKYRNAWNELPHVVSLGAQKNFSKFATYIVEEWNQNEKQFNQGYFRDTISQAILFHSIDTFIPYQPWYEQGYKANIVVYTLAYFHYLIKQQFKDMQFNLHYIWDKQQVPEVLIEEFQKLAYFVFKHITDEKRPITNVTEWCKKEQCWLNLKGKEYILSTNVKEFLISQEEAQKHKSDNKKEFVLNKGIEVQSEVINKGQEYWSYAIIWGKAKHILNDVEISFLQSATKMNFGRIPTEKQCQRILNIEAKLIEEGYNGQQK